jgi:hypothetical protein
MVSLWFRVPFYHFATLYPDSREKIIILYLRCDCEAKKKKSSAIHYSHGSQRQLTAHWPQFKILRQRFAVTRFEEQRQLHMPQKHKTHTSHGPGLACSWYGDECLGEQADNAKAHELHWKPLSWLGTLRPTTANDACDQPLWETFVCTTLGLEVPVLASLPRRNQRAPALCGCKKHGMDLFGDHTFIKPWL